MPAPAANCHRAAAKMWNRSYKPRAGPSGGTRTMAPFGAARYWYRSASIGVVFDARSAGR